MRQLTIYIDDNLHYQLKNYAAKHKTYVTFIVNDAIASYLKLKTWQKL